MEIRSVMRSKGFITGTEMSDNKLCYLDDMASAESGTHAPITKYSWEPYGCT